MKFLTEVNITKPQILIEHTDSILTIGSCFAENVGAFFNRLKFNSLVNPFGVLYNSASIKNSLQLIGERRVFSEEDLIFDQSEWHSFYHHSDFSNHKVESILSSINSNSASTYNFLKKTDWMVISLGTSFVFHHKSKGIIVSNCHKIPQKEFERKFLDVEDNVSNLKEIVKIQKEINPNTKFIFTVSPVRHLRDGAHENQLSKSSLLLAVESLVNQIDDAFYFPSYEIMMDELRDYRFYDKDLLHPNSQAVEYIWEKFSKNCFSSECLTLIEEIEKIVNAAEHKVRNLHSDKNKQFAKAQIHNIEKILEQHTYINFENELTKFTTYLNEK